MTAIFTCFKLPEVLLIDNGTCFTAKISEYLLEALGVEHKMISPYHPQTNGMLERGIMC